MVCLEDVADITLPEGSCRFDYLLAVCKRASLLLEKEERNKQEKKDWYNDDDQYYLGGVDLDKNLITPSNPTMPEIVILPKDTEEERKKKPSGKRNTLESVISHSREGGRASSKRIRYGGEAMEEKNNSKKQKKGPRVLNNGPEPPQRLPVKFRNLIHQLAGNRAVSMEKLLIQKELTKTDVSGIHNRLSIPENLLREEFLTEEENHLLRQHNGKNVCSIDEVQLITPMMEVEKVSLRRWEMKKKSGASSVSYVLTNTWNEIRRRNKFEGKMMVQLWAIRVDSHLWMALVTLS